MAQYKKKIINVFAVKYTGLNADEIITFCGGINNQKATPKNGNLEIKTRNGNKIVNSGDYVVIINDELHVRGAKEFETYFELV